MSFWHMKEKLHQKKDKKGEKKWIHTFPKGISAMWNPISLVQGLNSCRRVHFLRQ